MMLMNGTHRDSKTKQTCGIRSAHALWKLMPCGLNPDVGKIQPNKIYM